MTPLFVFWLLVAVLAIEIVGIAVYARWLGRQSADSVLRAELAELADALEVQRRTVRRLSARVGMRDTRSARLEDGAPGDLEPPARPPDPRRERERWLSWAAAEAARRNRGKPRDENPGPGLGRPGTANIGRAGARQLDFTQDAQEAPKKRRGRPPKTAQGYSKQKALNGSAVNEETRAPGEG